MGLLRDYTGNPINFLLSPIDWPPWPSWPGAKAAANRVRQKQKKK